MHRDVVISPRDINTFCGGAAALPALREEEENVRVL